MVVYFFLSGIICSILFMLLNNFCIFDLSDLLVRVVELELLDCD